jgi:hypothetical protein
VTYKGRIPEPYPDREPDPAFGAYKFELLWNLVAEDDEMLYEPVAWLRGGAAVDLNVEVPASEEQRRDWAERAMHELLDEDLIYLYRWQGDVDQAKAAGDPTARLDADEARDVIRERGWAPIPPARVGTEIWLAPTPRADALYDDTFPGVRR